MKLKMKSNETNFESKHSDSLNKKRVPLSKQILDDITEQAIQS